MRLSLNSRTLVESQDRITSHGRQQLVKSRYPGRPFGAVAELTAAIINPADAWDGERLREIGRCDDLTDPVNSRDSDRPEPLFGLPELIRPVQIPTIRQENILVDEHEPLVPGAVKAGVQSVRRAGTFGKRDDFMNPAGTKTGRGQKVGA
jgi:hypothetical protein